MNKSKGFTIIELIVVIAIIAILASIVLINVSSYINKAKDASVKEAMHTLQTDAISTANGGAFDNTVCADTNLSYKAIHGTNGFDTSIVCNAATTTPAAGAAWCAAVKLPSTPAATTNSYYCVDSTGAAVTSAQATRAAACPAADGLCKQ